MGKPARVTLTWYKSLDLTCQPFRKNVSVDEVREVSKRELKNNYEEF